MKKLMKLCEVADVLNCSIKTVHRMIGEAALMAIQLRGGWRVSPDDLQIFIERSREQHKEDYGYCE